LLLVIVGALPVTADEATVVRLGLITDLHAHDLDSPLEGKWMTHTEERLATFTTAMNAWAPDFVIELGDFINGWVVLGTEPGDPSRIPDILTWANDLYRQFDGPAYYVLGNHDVYNLDKPTICSILGIDATYYSFDVGAYHFIVLDVQFAEDGSDLAYTYTGVAGFVPDSEMAWLRADLEATDTPTLICVHQRLDDFIEAWGRPTVLNQAALQQLFAEDGDVIAVFQGHDHANVHNVIDGIHYVTFEAMVDQDTPPSWAQITLDPELRRIQIEGFGDQASYDLAYP
jgi:alkaline phosphatase